MKQSDIFNRFVKIAEDKGIVDLYEVKPDAPEEMSYKSNIMEIAHPESAIVSPAYDKLNGLVENNIERQNILLNIVNKENNGLHTQHKYATQQLMLSLIRVANDLDNSNKDELRILADNCIEQLNKKASIKKEAFPWLIAAAVGGLVALYLNQHMENEDREYKQNYQELKHQLDELIDSSKTLGVGQELNILFKVELQNFKNMLEKFNGVYLRNESLLNNLDKPRTKSEFNEFVSKFDYNSYMEAYNEFRESADEMNNYLDGILEKFKDRQYKYRQIKDTGFFTKLLDKYKLRGGMGLFADDFDQVAQAIPAYKQSIQSILERLQGAEKFRSRIEENLESSRISGATSAKPKKRKRFQSKSNSIRDLESRVTGNGQEETDL